MFIFLWSTTRQPFYFVSANPSIKKPKRRLGRKEGRKEERKKGRKEERKSLPKSRNLGRLILYLRRYQGLQFDVKLRFQRLCKGKRTVKIDVIRRERRFRGVVEFV